MSEREACPCLHTTPCDPDCTCVNPVMSRGCQRCCSYGSKEQQRAMAERLASLEPTVKALREERELAMEALALCRADIRHRPKLSAHVDALIARLASPSVPAVSAEEKS